MPNDLTAAESALLCALSLMRWSFKQLATEYAKSDRPGAEQALQKIETTVARELLQIRESGFLGANIDDTALRDIALELRDMAHLRARP